MSAVLRPDCFVQTVVAAALRHCSENTELIYTDSCFQQQFDCFRIRIVVAGGYFHRLRSSKHHWKIGLGT